MGTTYLRPPVKPAVGDEVPTLVANLSNQIGRLSAGTATVDALLYAERAFIHLRALAESNRSALTGKVEELRELRKRLEEIKAPLTAQLVDALEATRAELRGLQGREEELREALAWLSRSSGQQTLRGAGSQASVESRVRRCVPAAGTPGRLDLERVVREAGVWDRVSILWGPTLDRELGKRDFPAAARGRIEPLCPRRAVATVRVRPGR